MCIKIKTNVSSTVCELFIALVLLLFFLVAVDTSYYHSENEDAERIMLTEARGNYYQNTSDPQADAVFMNMRFMFWYDSFL